MKHIFHIVNRLELDFTQDNIDFEQLYLEKCKEYDLLLEKLQTVTGRVDGRLQDK